MLGRCIVKPTHATLVDFEKLPGLRRILLKASNGIVTGNSFIKPKFIAAQVCLPNLLY